MFVILNVTENKFAKHTGETKDGILYVEYPWQLVNNIEEAQQYITKLQANEIAFWNLDKSDTWNVVNVATGERYPIELCKYFP